MIKYQVVELNNEDMVLCQFNVSGLPYVVDITDEIVYYEDTRGYKTISYIIDCLVHDLTRDINSQPELFTSETIKDYKENIL